MHTVLKLAQLRWTGHDERHPKKVFCGEALSRWEEKTVQRHPKASPLKDFDIPFGSWDQTAQDRSKLRGLINKGAALYKKESL